MKYRKEIGVVPVIASVLIFILCTFLFFVLPGLTQSMIDLQIGDGVFKARVITDESGLEKGLADIDNIDKDQALLMVFSGQEKWKVSMKNISKPLDIVWLNSDKQIVYIVKNISINDETPAYFVPKFPAKYVIGLPYGTVDGKAIMSRKFASFQIKTNGGASDL